MIDPQILGQIRFFELLDDEDRLDLAKLVDDLPMPQGARLFETGDPGEELYIVHSGKVEIFIKNVAGEKIVLTIAEQGDLFGELSMLDSGPRSATAVALEDTKLIVLNRENLLLFFKKKPDAALDMIAAMGAMIRKADDILRTQVSRNVNEEMEEKLTLIQSASDWLAWFSGSMPFLALISQNRQADKDRVRSNIDYEVNVKAEMEVAHLHEKTDRLHEKMPEEFARLRKAMEGRRDDDLEQKARYARPR